MKRVTVDVVLCLVLSLVEANSEKRMYLTFMAETLPNHFYVHLKLVGSDNSSAFIVTLTFTHAVIELKDHHMEIGFLKKHCLSIIDLVIFMNIV